MLCHPWLHSYCCSRFYGTNHGPANTKPRMTLAVVVQEKRRRYANRPVLHPAVSHVSVLSYLARIMVMGASPCVRRRRR